MNAIQKFLRDNGTLIELQEKYSLSIKNHPQHNNLVLFKYDQVNSRPENHPFVVCARGLILDADNNWDIVNWPYNRFFNYGQGVAANFDFDTATALLKLDGSLINLWNYKNNWHVSTNNLPSAEGQVGDFNFSFAEFFWRVFNDMSLPLPNDPELCYMFELTSIFNKVVVIYPKPQLTLTGVRNKITGLELLPEQFPQYPQVMSFPFNNINEVKLYVDAMPGKEMEGFVIRSAQRDEYGGFLRLKIKGEPYTRLHHIKGSWSMRNAVEIIINNEQEEVKVSCPEYISILDEIKQRYDTLIINLANIYNDIKHITDRKEFALTLQSRKSTLPGALYALRDNSISSIQEYLHSIHIKHVMRALGLKDEKET